MKRFVATISLMATLGVSACAPMDRYAGGVFDSVATLGGNLGAPWGGTRPLTVDGGTTVARVRAGGGMGGAETLLPEEGNVWPAAEGPRATLANPDEALRGIPSYRPNVDPQVTPPFAAPPPGERPRRQPRSSGAAHSPLENEPPPPVTSVAPRLATPRPPLAGSTIIAPDGSSRVITGSQGNVGTTLSPTGQSGTLLRQGNTTILQEPGQPAQQLLNQPGR